MDTLNTLTESINSLEKTTSEPVELLQQSDWFVSLIEGTPGLMGIIIAGSLPLLALIATIWNQRKMKEDEYNHALIQQKTELNSFLWKEKIDAAKNASEYYLEQITLLRLLELQFETLSLEDGNSLALVEIMQKELHEKNNKFKEFPHFSHHHIHIFYKVDYHEISKVGKEIIRFSRNVGNVKFLDKDTSEETQQKLDDFKNNTEKLKDCYTRLLSLHDGILKLLREDIQNHIEN